MFDYKRLLLAAALWALALNPVLAASSNLFPMNASPAFPNANQYFYCPVVSGATTGTEYKCTIAQFVAYLANAPTLAETSSHSIASTENGTLFLATGTGNTQTLPTSAAGFNVAVQNGNATGGANITVATTGGQTINVGGTPTAGSVTLTPGQTMYFAADPPATGWLGTTGPAGPQGPAGSSSVTGPGVVATTWLSQAGASTASGVSVANPVTTNTAYCEPYWTGSITPTNGTGTLGGLSARLSTAGTTTEQTGVYASTVPPALLRPIGAALSTSNQASTTSGQPIMTFATGPSLASSTLYWLCFQAGDTTLAYIPISTTRVSAAPPYMLLVGTTTAQGTNYISGVTTVIGTNNYGTWPTFTSGTTWTEDNSHSPFLNLEYQSVP